MTEPITGSVAEVLDSYQIVVNRGADDGVTDTMKFRVFATRGITDPDRERRLETLEIDKATVTPKEIYEKMTLMETTTESYDIPPSQIMSSLPNFPVASGTKQEKLKTDDDVEDDVKIVRTGDSVKQVLDTDSSNAAGEPVAEKDSPS